MTPTDTLTREVSTTDRGGQAPQWVVSGGRTVANTQADASSTPAADRQVHRHRSSSAARPRRLTDVLLHLAALTMAVIVALALATLGVTLPGEGEITAVEGPALAAGIVGMSSAVIGLILGYIAAVRSER